MCLTSGYLYAVGGHDGIIYLKTVERYDPKTNEWTFVASMGARRGGVGVAALGGCLYATGGYDGSSNLSTSGKKKKFCGQQGDSFSELNIFFLFDKTIQVRSYSLLATRAEGG